MPSAPAPGERSKQALPRDVGGLNIGYAAELLEQVGSGDGSSAVSYREAPDHVVVSPTNGNGISPEALDAGTYDRIRSYAESIRDFGYRAARLDPLGMHTSTEERLSPETHRVTEQDLALPAARMSAYTSAAIETGPLPTNATTGDVIRRMQQVYCGTIGYEFSHVRNSDERAWLRDQVELNRTVYLGNEDQRKLLGLLTRAETFERFLHRAFPGQRWYSLEGLESLVVVLDQIVLYSSHTDVRNIVLGMAHRGRLNILAHVFDKPYEEIIAGFSEGHYVQLAALEASGWLTDVKYHQGARLDRDVDGDGTADVRIHMLPNPSHLEMVDPVVGGAVRAMQDSAGSVSESMGIVVHGDAAFAGQGVVAETLNLAQLPGYTTGGTIHIIANNQLGFTTEPEDAYSTEHPSDIARGFEIPVVHVNADDVAACVAVAKLAIAYRQTFHRDFLIDLVGYRRFGHNENDEPRFTQPIMYQKISRHPSVRRQYADRLVEAGVLTSNEAKKMQSEHTALLQATKDKIDSELVEGPFAPPDLGLSRNSFHGLEHPDSAVDNETLETINARISSPPAGFTPHPKVKRVLDRRIAGLREGGSIDWGHAEALALGSILKDGVDVRLTGQDVRRGTFSHRHATLFDVETGEPWVSLDGFGNSRFWVNNSPLSEVATVGFEQGYSVMSTESLVIWEAQFGDFVNNAQSVIDEMVASARDKWDQDSGLVMLLPHGYEGQGPNHSHAHIERFLALAAKNNMRIAYPTTAAQYFHLLRSQAAILQEEPLPLIVMTGKSLLRHPMAAATAKQLCSGGFKRVIRYQKPGTGLEKVKRVIFCTGKVFVDLAGHEDFAGSEGISVIRFEELYPFPVHHLERELKKVPNAEHFTWLQEEPQNRGAWSFMRPRITRCLPRGAELRYVGRPATPSPAEGSHWLHMLQQEHLVRVALGTEEPVSAFV